MIAIYTSYFDDIIAYFVSSNFLFTIPQKLSKRTVSWPLSHRMTTFTTSRVSPGPTWILKPSAIFSSSMSWSFDECRRAARDHTALSVKPTPVDIVGFHIHFKGNWDSVSFTCLPISSPFALLSWKKLMCGRQSISRLTCITYSDGNGSRDLGRLCSPLATLDFGRMSSKLQATPHRLVLFPCMNSVAA